MPVPCQLRKAMHAGQQHKVLPSCIGMYLPNMAYLPEPLAARHLAKLSGRSPLESGARIAGKPGTMGKDIPHLDGVCRRLGSSGDPGCPCEQHVCSSCDSTRCPVLFCSGHESSIVWQQGQLGKYPRSHPGFPFRWRLLGIGSSYRDLAGRRLDRFALVSVFKRTAAR